MTKTATRYDPLSPQVQADPYPFYASLRRDAAVYYVESLQGFAVSRYTDARRVMHDAATFSSEAMAALVARPVDYAADGLAPGRASGVAPSGPSAHVAHGRGG